MEKYIVQYDDLKKNFDDLQNAYEFAESKGLLGFDIIIWQKKQDQTYKIIAEDRGVR